MRSDVRKNINSSPFRFLSRTFFRTRLDLDWRLGYFRRVENLFFVRSGEYFADVGEDVRAMKERVVSRVEVEVEAFHRHLLERRRRWQDGHERRDGREEGME